MLKKTVNISLWVVLFGGLLALLGFAEVKRNTTRCNAVDVNIVQNDAGFFITPFVIQNIIGKQQGNPIGKPMDEINILKMEKALRDNPYILNVQVYATLGGQLEMKVVQKKPIAMVINSDGESYYLDSCGYIMPLSPSYTARTLVVNGMINEPYARYYGQNMEQLENDTAVHTQLTSVYKLADYIYHNPFWKAQVTEIYVDSANDFCLIPRVGGQRIILGDTSDLAQKFNKLWILYRDGLNSTGKWNEYSAINLKYKYQIVCTKK